MDWDIPTFGERREDRNYIERPGAYAIVHRNDELLVVQEQSGWLLPGGGREDGESLTETLHREMLEETGFRLVQSSRVARVRQFLISEVDDSAYAKDCHIFEADLADRSRDGHLPFCWMSPDEATEHLAYASFRWVVKQLRGRA